MVQIKPEGNGFQMNFSEPGTGTRGFAVKAENLTEVHSAINHYMGGKEGHSHAPQTDCPLCRKMAQAATRKGESE